MSNGNEGHSRRQVLTTVGRLSIAGAMGQAIASSPAAAAEPNSEIAEKTFEATADNVVNTLEAAYGVNRGKRLPVPGTKALVAKGNDVFGVTLGSTHIR